MIEVYRNNREIEDVSLTLKVLVLLYTAMMMISTNHLSLINHSFLLTGADELVSANSSIFLRISVRSFSSKLAANKRAA